MESAGQWEGAWRLRVMVLLRRRRWGLVRSLLRPGVMVRTWWAVLVGALLWLVPRGAEATVWEPCPTALTPVVPVGGWIPVSERYAGVKVEVSVTSEGGPVAGEVVYVAGKHYWRPEATLPSGTLLTFATPGCDGTRPSAPFFQVRVEGRELPPQIDFTPSFVLSLDESRPAEHVACGRDEALLEEAGYCCADCSCPEAGQVPVALAEAWRGKVQWLDGTGAGAQGQVLVRQVEWFGEALDGNFLRPDEWTEPQAHNVEVGEEPLCTTFEVLVVPTEETTELRRCVDPPTESLGVQRVVPRFEWVGIASCTVPPEGAEAAWCEHFRYRCVSSHASERNGILCRHHYELCGSEPLGSGGSLGGSGGTTSGGTSTGGASAEVDKTVRAGNDCSNDGCSAAPRPSSFGLGGVGGGVLLLGSIGMLRRRWA